MKKTCLAVDDSRTIRRVARKILAELQFDVIEAENGCQALDRCHDRMPDAVLLDWNMPEMNGLALLEGLRKLPGGSRPVVPMCSTIDEPDQIMRAIEAGANEFVMKPFSPVILKAKLWEVGLVESA